MLLHSVSGGQPLIVFAFQAQDLVPEGFRLLVGKASGKDVQVHVPARGKVEQSGAIRHAAVNEGEQHVTSLRCQLERNATVDTPGDCQLVRRVEFGDPTLHAALSGGTARALAGRIRELVVAPYEFNGRAEL